MKRKDDSNMIAGKHHICMIGAICMMIMLGIGSSGFISAAGDDAVLQTAGFDEKEYVQLLQEEGPGERLITEKVSYRNLMPGERYYLQGKLILRTEDESEEVISTAYCGFTAESADGTVALEYVLPDMDYSGKKIISHTQLSRVSVWYPEESSSEEGLLGPAVSRVPVAEMESFLPDDPN